jgi:signal transduction histidine kinase/CheY-like chemotaxis protein
MLMNTLSTTAVRADGTQPPHVPLWLALLVTLVAVAGFGYLRLGVFPEHFVPLSSILALLVCLWHRDVRLLWGMVTAFLAMLAYKVTVLLPLHDTVSAQEWLFAGMQSVNLIVGATVIHAVMRLAGQLESTIAHLEASNVELEASNEELAAREEEISRQNEELQAQTEELEQQTEELNTQTEELHALNEQLVEREQTLRDLLDSTADRPDDGQTLMQLGAIIERLLGHRAAGAAVLQQDAGDMSVRPLFGVSQAPQRISRERTLADLVLRRGRAGSLADTALRTDLQIPILASGRAVRSMAAAPLKLDDAPAGALEVYSTEPGDWAEYELRLVQWLAEQCGRMLAIAAMRAEREALLASERAARTDAERANHAKDEFVSMLSHELRTPLHAVLGWAAVLRKGGGKNSAEVMKGLEVIERNARQQGQLISDLLDISRIMVGKLHLDLHTVDVPLVVESALDSVRQTAEAKGVRLERHVGNITRQIVGDPMRLQQVVWNLLTNAIKFTPAGGVVKVSVTQLAAHVDITVSDTGEGMDPDAVPQLFERYRQADGSATRRHGGLGLGLSIVKSLAELHGGDVTVQTEGIGKGSAFTVRLPLQPAAPRNAEKQALQADGMLETDSPALTGLTILIVDDEPDARDLVTYILTDRGAVAHQAASGEEALAMLDTLPADILISDIGMPGMDGYTLIRTLRERSSPNQRPMPAIALTAFARSEDRTRALLAGFQSHVAKPVEAAELIAAVASLRYAVRPRVVAMEDEAAE